MRLFKNQETNGESDWKDIQEGRYVFKAVGDFASGTLTLRWRDPSDPTRTLAFMDDDLTAPGGFEVSLGRGQVQAEISGATDPGVDINAYLFRL